MIEGARRAAGRNGTNETSDAAREGGGEDAIESRNEGGIEDRRERARTSPTTERNDGKIINVAKESKTVEGRTIRKRKPIRNKRRPSALAEKTAKPAVKTAKPAATNCDMIITTAFCRLCAKLHEEAAAPEVGWRQNPHQPERECANKRWAFPPYGLPEF